MNGLPALAQDVASRGRNGDSMLVHMTPGEVQGLQALALAHGGSLSVNPDTGLVEANFLKRLLPAIAGAALTIGTGGAINPATAGMIVGGAETLRTGNLGRGFMAGLGAYGGAGLGAGFSAAGASATPGATVDASTFSGVNPSVPYDPATMSYGASPVAPTVGQNFATAGRGFEALGTESGRTAFLGQPSTATTPATGVGGYSGLAKSTLATALPFMEQEQAAMPTPEDPYANYKGPYKPSDRAVRYPSADERRRLGTGEFTYFTPSNPIPYAEGGEVSPAQAQVLQNIANVQNLAGLPAIDASMFGAQPAAARPAPRAGLVYNPIQSRNNAIPSRETNYGFKAVEYADKPDLSGLDMGGGIFGQLKGNGLPPPQYSFDPTSQTLRPSQAYLDAIASRRQQITDEQAAAAAAQAASMNQAWAKGGSVPTLEEGGFVLTKKAVDGLGGGNNKRGQQVAQKTLGAKPIRGPGTGTSDSIRTSIAGKQPALVSNGEAYVPEKKVKQNGGAKAFYELMARAEKAAKA